MIWVPYDSLTHDSLTPRFTDTRFTDTRFTDNTKSVLIHFLGPAPNTKSVGIHILGPATITKSLGIHMRLRPQRKVYECIFEAPPLIQKILVVKVPLRSQ